MVGLSIGWALTLHPVDDVVASRLVRRYRVEQTIMLHRTLPDGSALVAYWGARDAAGPLLLEKDLVVLDAHADEGRTAPVLIRELLARGRPVFVLSGVVLAGDLYHYPEERSLRRLPTADVDVNETRLSRERLEAFLSRTRSQLWIQDDLTAAQGWRKAPAYYD